MTFGSDKARSAVAASRAIRENKLMIDLRNYGTSRAVCGLDHMPILGSEKPAMTPRPRGRPRRPLGAHDADPRDVLATMLAQLRDRTHWPPAPPRPLVPLSDADLDRLLVPAEPCPVLVRCSAGRTRLSRICCWMVTGTNSVFSRNRKSEYPHTFGGVRLNKNGTRPRVHPTDQSRCSLRRTTRHERQQQARRTPDALGRSFGTHRKKRS